MSTFEVFTPKGTIRITEAIRLVRARAYGPEDLAPVDVFEGTNPDNDDDVEYIFLRNGEPLKLDDISRSERHQNVSEFIVQGALRIDRLTAEIAVSGERHIVPASYWDVGASEQVLKDGKFSSNGTPAYANYEGALVVIEKAAFDIWLAKTNIEVKDEPTVTDNSPSAVAPSRAKTKSPRGRKRGPYYKPLTRLITNLYKIGSELIGRKADLVRDIRKKAAKDPQQFPGLPTSDSTLYEAINRILAEIDEEKSG
jgi:hypothetical protein